MSTANCTRIPSPLDLLEWFFLQTLAGDVFYQVRERLLAADMLVLMAKGLDDDEIDSRLSLLAGTTVTKGYEVLRNPGISRRLLQKSAEVFQADQPNRQYGAWPTATLTNYEIQAYSVKTNILICFTLWLGRAELG